MKRTTAIILIIITLLLLVSAYFYFTYISPSFIQKPIVEKPTLATANQEQNETTNELIGEQHIEYLVTEIGGYKLHDDPVTKEPAVIEINVTDTGARYAVTITDNEANVKIGKAQNPDLRLHTPQTELVALLSTDEGFEQLVVDKAMAGDLWIEILVDEKTLALKGYKGIYDTLNKDADIAVTGNTISQLDVDWWDVIKSRQK